jgi:epoxyqueuosine reductase
MQAQAKVTIRARARKIGIDSISFCDASPLEETRAAFEAAIERGFIPHESAPRPSSIIRLTTPSRHLRAAKSIIAAYESYYTGEAECSDPRRGTIAYYARCNHYEDLKEKLLKLAAFIEGKYGCRTKASSCYVSLAEKPIARRAGLGFYGKHGIIITPGHGSLVVLGEIVTDLEIEPDQALQMDCGKCNLCIEACPTGAIRSAYHVDRNLCIQYLSERRLTIPEWIRDLWGNRLYGCTTCQDVCPHNRGLVPVSREVSRGVVGASIPLTQAIPITEEEFEVRFADNQIGMRERNAVRRNAIIAAGNSRCRTFLTLLEACTKDEDPMIREHSLWAVAKITGTGDPDD